MSMGGWSTLKNKGQNVKMLHATRDYSRMTEMQIKLRPPTRPPNTQQTIQSHDRNAD
jgi:hypothetical protein